jgi:hypothetical protein
MMEGAKSTRQGDGSVQKEGERWVRKRVRIIKDSGATNRTGGRFVCGRGDEPASGW